MNRQFTMAVVMGAALLAGMAEVQAQAPGSKPQPPASTAPTPGPGPGYGCPGGGGGPGMGGYGMGGYGMGPGMMGGYGMGPGMMGGYGMGPGMMGGGMGYGHGPGYGMGYGPGYGLAGLNLTDQQRKNVNTLLDGQQKVHHNAMGKIMEQNSRLRDLYSQEKWDANAIAAAYDEISKQRSVMIRSRIDTRNKIYDLLTPQQRQQFRRSSEPVPES